VNINDTTTNPIQLSLIHRQRPGQERHPRAPAISHKSLSSPASIRAAAVLGQIQQFRCFQIVQAPSTMRELKPVEPCRWTSQVIFATTHQSQSHYVVELKLAGRFVLRWYQNWWVKAQEIKRWSIISTSWSQKGHFSDGPGPALA
jgi:hypothetical protein